MALCAIGTAVTAGQQKEEEEKEEEEEIYAPLGVNDEYDTILNSTKAPAIANRPPAPTPRPQSSAEEDRTPYIAKGICDLFLFLPPFIFQRIPM